MTDVLVSVVVPTYDRPDKLAATLHLLGRQDLPTGTYEIVVVDDGSSPPAALPPAPQGGALRLLRLEGVGRSWARNAGARHARGRIVAFVDDDIGVTPSFLGEHVRAHDEWRDALAVGAVGLPPEHMHRPFVQFRQALERAGAPVTRGPVEAQDFCTANNMSMLRDAFLALGGFDEAMSSAEDQDLALRHTARGGRIVYLPAAAAIHNDHSLDIRSYCRRMEWGYEQLLPFCLRYPERAANQTRARVNGPLDWSADGGVATLRKLVKAALALPPATSSLLWACGAVEAVAPRARLLDRLYRAALGVHIFRGYRRGLRRYRGAGHGPSAVLRGPRQVA